MIAAAAATNLPVLDEIRAGLPNICGWEAEIHSVVNHSEPVFLPITNLKLEHISAGFACALHMHQPTIPAGADWQFAADV